MLPTDAATELYVWRAIAAKVKHRDIERIRLVAPSQPAYHRPEAGRAWPSCSICKPSALIGLSGVKFRP